MENDFLKNINFITTLCERKVICERHNTIVEQKLTDDEYMKWLEFKQREFNSTERFTIQLFSNYIENEMKIVNNLYDMVIFEKSLALINRVRNGNGK